MSESSLKRSTILPLPSSPHWAPTTRRTGISPPFISAPGRERARESLATLPAGYNPEGRRERHPGPGPAAAGVRAAREGGSLPPSCTLGWRRMVSRRSAVTGESRLMSVSASLEAGSRPQAICAMFTPAFPRGCRSHPPPRGHPDCAERGGLPPAARRARVLPTGRDEVFPRG